MYLTAPECDGTEVPVMPSVSHMQRVNEPRHASSNALMAYFTIAVLKKQCNI
jgi:hypothetical protein